MSIYAKLSAVALGVPLLLPVQSAFAADTVTVSLWDKPGATMSMELMMGGPVAPDPATNALGITATPATVAAGEVTFNVTNSGQYIHEMVVIPVASATTPLPYDAVAMSVDEDAAGALGEVAELQPGTSGSVTLTLAAGTYVLVCNVPGHYAAGMWTILTVQ